MFVKARKENMKKILLILFFLGLFLPGFAYDKKSLVERFTNASCGPCAQINNAWYNATTRSLINSGAISHLVYNVWWPGANDPMYLLNQPDNTTRTNYYGCNYVPWIEVNGTQITETQAALTNAVTNGNSEYAPFNIIISQGVVSNNLIEVAVKIIRDPGDVTTFENVKLRVALTEKTVAFSNPPGSNGESVFYSISRKMLPGAGGSTFTIPAPGDSVLIAFQYVPTAAFLQAVILDSLRAVAFIQNDNTKEIYQSNMRDLNQNYMATIITADKYQFGSSASTAEYTAYIKNIGLFPDTYNISIDFDGPAGWSQSFTTINGTFNYGQTDTVTVNPGDSTEIQVSINANSHNGFGKTYLNFISDQGSYGSTEFRFTTFGLNVLVVDDDGDKNYENYIDNELDNMSAEYGIITSDFIPANIGNLNTFDIIVWNTAATEPGISADELNALIAFLDNGGSLYLNGVDLAYQMADPTSPYYTTESNNFFNNYLHSAYVLRQHQATITQGIDGDPITDSLAMVRLTGGTGANTINHNNGKYANRISAQGSDAFNILNFWLKPSEYAGVRAVHNGTSGTGKVLFTTFGFETIADQSTRTLFAQKLIAWLNTPTGVEEDPSVYFPREFMLYQNFPNPFNPTTSIKYTLPERAAVSIKVYDVLGNLVDVILDDTKEAGIYEVTYDASGIASGVYFYQFKAGEFVSVRKMNIIK